MSSKHWWVLSNDHLDVLYNALELSLRNAVVYTVCVIPLQCMQNSKARCKSGWDNVALYRFSERQQNLPSEHMTVVSRRGAVDHNPVTVVQLLDFKISPELLWKTKKNPHITHTQTYSWCPHKLVTTYIHTDTHRTENVTPLICLH